MSETKERIELPVPLSIVEQYAKDGGEISEQALEIVKILERLITQLKTVELEDVSDELDEEDEITPHPEKAGYFRLEIQVIIRQVQELQLGILVFFDPDIAASRSKERRSTNLRGFIVEQNGKWDVSPLAQCTKVKSVLDEVRAVYEQLQGQIEET